PPFPTRRSSDLNVLDALLFLDARAMHGHARPDDLLDLLLLELERLLLGDALELGLAFATDRFQSLVLQDALVLDRDRALAILLGDFDLALLVLLVDGDFFLELDARELGLLALLGLDAHRFGLLTGTDAGDLTRLLGDGVLLLPLELQDRLAGLDVLLLGVFLRFAT